MIDARKELGLLLRSRYPFVHVQSSDEARVEALLDSVARDQGMRLFIWSGSRGLRQSGGLVDTRVGRTLEEALVEARRMPEETLFLFKDLQSYLENPQVVRRLLDLAALFVADRRALVFSGPDPVMPAALRHQCAALSLPLPSDEELIRLAWRVVHDFSQGQDVRMDLDSAAFRRLIEGLRGLTHVEAERALCRAVADDMALTPDDIDEVLRVKQRVLREGGVLEYVPVDIGPDALGGLDALKAWLALRKDALSEEAREFGLPAPKGLVLLGVQGCGKSLAAKFAAAQWELPLLRLEAGRLYDKYIGESDKNLEQALAAAEHMAPCVLMIDEIEKAFAYSQSADSDGGLSRRIFGRLLTWLQDREAPVFLVATCNDVAQLPPELMRKGRFDEIFFIDLPDDAEREAVFHVHLRSRDRDPADFDLAALSKASKGFSGAEIEQVVVAGLYAAFPERAPLTTEILLAEIAATKPLSVTRREDVDALRAWVKGRAVPASA
jgi:SpoVK/Ycf46/Vps4 family AAA+-type ATPase